MRISMLIGSALFAFNTFAATMLHLEVDSVFGNYVLDATMTPDPQFPLMGQIQATSAFNGDCRGTYKIDFSKETLSIDFDGIDGPGTAGGCNNESLVAEVSIKKYQGLQSTGDTYVIFRSTSFFMAPMLGHVTVVTKN